VHERYAQSTVNQSCNEINSRQLKPFARLNAGAAQIAVDETSRPRGPFVPNERLSSQHSVRISNGRGCRCQQNQGLLPQEAPITGFWDGEGWLCHDCRIEVTVEEALIKV
jgi:hypothetical protein